MTATTVADMTALTGVQIITDYADDLTIPVHTGAQRQGDVLVLPDPAAAARTPVPQSGTPVVVGESGGNTHAIYAVPGMPVFCDPRPATASDLVLGTLVVPDGSVAYLGHPEHGYAGIGPGSYTVRRQREFAETVRLVAD